jgi:hypothetical protein
MEVKNRIGVESVGNKAGLDWPKGRGMSETCDEGCNGSYCFEAWSQKIMSEKVVGGHTNGVGPDYEGEDGGGRRGRPRREASHDEVNGQVSEKHHRRSMADLRKRK